MELGKTVVCEYGATGEGITHMVLICLAENGDAAIERFTREYGSYYAIGAEVYDGLRFDLPACKLLISEATQKALTRVYNEGQPTGNMVFTGSLHFNFS